MSDNRVAVLLGQGFEDSEFRVPYDRLKAAGAQVDVIGPQAGEELRGYKGKELVRADRGIAEASVEDYDALVIPGGQSPDHLRADERFVRFVEDFDRTGRPLAAVCHGPQLLIAAGLVRGRTLTAWKTVQDDLRKIGAEVRDEPVVEDGNWITSRKPEDLDAFSDALVRALERGRDFVDEREAEVPRFPARRRSEPPAARAGSDGEPALRAPGRRGQG
jgi:protease I